jgi:Reverse transcriptase (RNA-dependent DNA polymerase)
MSGRSSGQRSGGRSGGRSSYTGRGRGRSSGRQGRSGGSSSSSKSNQQEILKFTPHGIGRQQQVSTYDTVKEAIIIHVQKTYVNGQDTAKSLRDLVKLDLTAAPVRIMSTLPRTDASEILLANQDQEAKDVVYKARVSMWLKRCEVLDQNLGKAYALIFGSYCNKTMQNRVEEDTNFETTIRDDPIELLKAIKPLMHDPARAKYPFASLTESIVRMINTRQKEGEHILDYVKRFKHQRDNMSTNFNTSDFLNTFITSTADYRNIDGPDSTLTATEILAEQASMKTGAYGRWMAFLLIRGSDQSKYGTVTIGLNSQYSMSNNQYPKTIQAASDILTNHKFDKGWDANRYVKKDDSTVDSEITTETSFAQAKAGTRCHCCGKADHWSPDCPLRDKKPRSEWFIKKKEQLQQHKEVDNEDDSSVDDNSSDDGNSIKSSRSNKSSSSAKTHWSKKSSKGKSHFQMNLNQKIAATRFDNQIILDNGSTFHHFKDENLVENIREADDILEMATNAGNKFITLVADVPGLDDEVRFDKEGIANLFSLSKLVKHSRITYDSDIEDSFFMHMKDGSVTKFEHTPEGLYAFKVDTEYKKDIEKSKSKTKKKGDCPQFIETVAENRKNYSLRDYERAKVARTTYHAVGAPSLTNYKAIIRANMIKNCPVTVADINIAERIFGADMSTLKGKSKRKTPKPVRNDLIEIPKELLLHNVEVELCIDVMYINQVKFLTNIDRSVRFRCIAALKTRTKEELFHALDKTLRVYNGAGFVIKQIYCDIEFQPMFDLVKDELDVKMNYANAGDHVPEAEHNNKTIQERFRVLYHRLPFDKLTRLMIRTFAFICCAQLNYFPAKGGISEYYSPHMIMRCENLDFNKNCSIEPGSFVQAGHDPKVKNTNEARTRDAIYLRPARNEQGGHECMDLHSGALIQPGTVKVLPMTQVVIDKVNALGEAQGFTSLKFKDKNKILLYDADWIEGVDYEREEEDDNDNNQNDNDDNNNNNDDDNYDYIEEEDIELDDDHEVDQEELDELLVESRNETVNPTQHVNEHDETEAQDEQEEEQEEQPEIPQVRQGTRGARNRNPVQRLIIENTRGQTYNQVRHEESVPGVPANNTAEQAQGVTFKDQVDDNNRKLEYCHNLTAQVHPNPRQDREYDSSLALVIARIIDDISKKVSMFGAQFGQQHMLHKGLKVWGERGSTAASKEMNQLHDRNCFSPVSVADMTPQERAKAMEMLMFLTEKRDESIKGRAVYNGKPTREWKSKEDSASPTASLESVMILSVIDAKERRDIMSCDIPNAFIQADTPEVKPGEERILMKITGVLVDMLVQMAPDVYGPYVVMEKGRKVLYVIVLKAIYGMLDAALLWYEKFRKDLEGHGFEFNPYDPCVANKTVNGKQQTIRYHVDDVMSSHVNKKVNDDFAIWLQEMYGEHSPVTIKRGDKHDYLGMIFEFKDGAVSIDMTSYVKDMLNDFPVKFKKGDKVPSPAGDDLFSVGNGPLLSKERQEIFHTIVAKGLYICKRARLDIQPTIAVLCTRTKAPNESDWKKLIRLMKFLYCTQDDKHTMCADNLQIIKWSVDSSFAVHPDFKSHTGTTMSLGQGAIQGVSRKQKLNTSSSTHAELVGADDAMPMVLWTKHFMEAQGFDIEQNIMFQDNKSTILLAENGRKSAGKRSRALNVRYFFITDQIAQGNLEILYCPTDDMISDYMTKPLQGEKFRKFRRAIMGMDIHTKK